MTSQRRGHKNGESTACVRKFKNHEHDGAPPLVAEFVTSIEVCQACQNFRASAHLRAVFSGVNLEGVGCFAYHPDIGQQVETSHVTKTCDQLRRWEASDFVAQEDEDGNYQWSIE